MEASAVDLFPDRLETLLEDGEFVLCRSRRRSGHDRRRRDRRSS